MAAPVLTTITADTWIRVAANVTSARIYAMTVGPCAYLHTYGLTGAGAPADLTTARPFTTADTVDYSAPSTAPIDVWVYCRGFAGQTRTDA